MNRFFSLPLMCIFLAMKGIAQYHTFPDYSLYNPPESPRDIPAKTVPCFLAAPGAHTKVVAENKESILIDSLYFHFN